MKVRAVRHRWERDLYTAVKTRKGDLKGIIAEHPTEICCDRMEEAWGEFVNFGEMDNYGYNEDASVNIYSCAPYPEGAVFSEMAIAFCPFCAEAIEVEVTE